MKSYHAILLLALPAVVACEKPDPVTVIIGPAIIEATVPSQVYLNAKEIVLDASPSKRLNPSGELLFLWSCSNYPTGAPPTISNATEAIAGIKFSERGIYEISLQVWTSPDNVNTKTFTLEVIPEILTSAPVISPLQDMNLQLPENYIMLNAEQNYHVNPVGRFLFFKWRIIEDPSTDYRPILTQDSISSTFAIMRSPGKYVIQLDVTNEINLTTSDSFVVNVLPDPLSGTEINIDNLLWKAEDDGWGRYSTISIKDQNIYKYRNRFNSTLSVWDDENQTWMDNQYLDWFGSEEGLYIISSLELEGKRTRIKLKYL